MNKTQNRHRSGRPAAAIVAERRDKMCQALLAGQEIKAVASDAGVSVKTAYLVARDILNMERRLLLPGEFSAVKARRAKVASKAA